MKKYLVKTVYLLAYYLGFINVLFVIKKRPIVITYHNIVEDELYDSHPHLSVTQKASVFERQLSIIKAKLPIGSDLEAGEALITFDDGHKNNLYVALPILQAQEVSATFFIPASYFENQGMLWVDRMLMWFTCVPSGTYNIQGKITKIATDTDRVEAFEDVWASLLENYAEKDRLLAELEMQYSFESLDITDRYRLQRFEPLCPEEIALLVEAGCRVACHSYTHEILSRLSDQELDEDFRRCERYVDLYNSDWYGYPFGRPVEVDHRVISRCEASIFDKAFMNIKQRGRGDFDIARINMPATDDKILIYAELSGFSTMLRNLRSTFT
ncbi:MAG: polysaccharide deacetylase family protein [Halioglobus sp.]|nr:polysaccharide deacetylase family protein [Halioglobus sp.]